MPGLTLTVEDPLRDVLIGYTAPAATARLTFSRVGPSGTPATVRSWDAAPTSPGPVIARDFEAPIGVLLTYTALAVDGSGATLETVTATVTIPSQGCDDTWLTDLARPANTLRLLIESLPELEFQVFATAHDVITRRDPIVTSDIAHTPALELSVLTDTLDERDQVRQALGNGVPVLLRTPPEDGIGNLYLSVLGYREQRIAAPGTLPARRFVIGARQVQRPDPALYAPEGPVTYAHVRNSFATYAVLRSSRATYDAVLYDWGGTSASDVVPWFPDDV